MISFTPTQVFAQETRPPKNNDKLWVQYLTKGLHSDYHFLFQQPLICGEPVEQLISLSENLRQAKDVADKPSRCKFLFEALTQSVSTHGVSIVGGCHGTSAYKFILPKRLIDCAQSDPNNLKKFEQLSLKVESAVKMEDSEIAVWSFSLAKAAILTAKSKLYYLKAKKHWEQYYFNFSGEEENQDYQKTLKALGIKKGKKTILGKWQTEADEWEFYLPEKVVLNKEKQNFVQSLIKATRHCKPCIRSEASGAIKQFTTLSESEEFKRYASSFVKETLEKTLESLELLLKNKRYENSKIVSERQNYYKLRDVAEADYLKLKEAVVSWLDSEFDVKRRFVPIY